MFRRIIFFSAVLLTLAVFFSCASASKASDAKNEEAKTFSIPSDKGVVYMYRRGRAVGAGVQYMVKVDGLEAGGTGPGTFFRWELEPGTYTFASSSSESSAVIELDVEAGKEYYVEQNGRIGVNDTRLKLNERSSKEGKREIAGCKLLVSSYNPK